MAFLLKNTPSSGLHARLAPLGVTQALARRIQASVVRRSVLPADSTLSPALMDRVAEATVIPRLRCLDRRVSRTDGFTKYLFAGDGEGAFESVLIPLRHRPGRERAIVCVSSQVGCAMGCAFCATGRRGFTRNLAPWEIVEQVAAIRRDTDLPVRGVVFMGMGEPLLNLDAVLTAISILSEPCGMAIAAKAMTISTVGITPGIRRLAATATAVKLVVSLTSADPALRLRLMPVERQHPTTELIEALRVYHAVTRQRVTLAWTLIRGLNDSEEDARRLAALLVGLPTQLDLIDVHDPDGAFQPPSDAERNAFRDALRRHVGIPVKRRYSGGADIDAACGRLSGGT